MKKNYEWLIVSQYDGPYGRKGAIISRHETYDNAEKAYNRQQPCGWLAIKNAREGSIVKKTFFPTTRK